MKTKEEILIKHLHSTTDSVLDSIDNILAAMEEYSSQFKSDEKNTLTYNLTNQ